MVDLLFWQKAAPCLLSFFCLYIAGVRGVPLPAGEDFWHQGPSGDNPDFWNGDPSWYHAPSPQYHDPYPSTYHDPSAHYYQPYHGVMSPAFASDPHVAMPWSPAPATPEQHAPVPWSATPATPEHHAPMPWSADPATAEHHAPMPWSADPATAEHHAPMPWSPAPAAPEQHAPLQHAPVPWSPAPMTALDETDHAILGSLLDDMPAADPAPSSSGGSNRQGFMSRMRSKLTGKAPATRERPPRPAPVPATESFPIFESSNPEHKTGEASVWPGNGGQPPEPFQGLEPVQAPKGPQQLEAIPLTPPPLPERLRGLKYQVNMAKDAQLRRKINIRLFDGKLKWINPENLPIDMRRSQRAAALEPSRLLPYVEDLSGSDGEARQVRMIPQEIIQTHDYGKYHIVDFWSYPKTGSKPPVIKHIGTGILHPGSVGWVERHLGFMSTLPEYSDYVFRRLRD